ncbi:hypothetical protein T01_2965 [Trichinella spiralis]|uniref:Uncharacterized protein n=1 Tax=Trichinella spiralis TaxID=6334 RepID=A0A0V1BGE7_TRISP|nr:hypothetical protein T01_2965 [Trichinella spiralis]
MRLTYFHAPGFALRLRPRANKNLHIPSGYASGVLLHHICPQGRFMQIFNPLGPEALPSGYAPGQIKICIFPQAMPQAIYSTIFDLRGVLCKFLIAWGLRPGLCLRQFFEIFEIFRNLAPGYASGQIKICILPLGD